MTTEEEKLLLRLQNENDTLKAQLKFNICKDIGERYQDFIVDELLKIGVCLNVYVSKDYQLNKGESASGIEIKHDSKWRQTGNLYIEFEALNKKQTEMIGGGIRKEDKSWLYLIGDETMAFIFSKKQLHRLYTKVSANQQQWYDKYGITIKQHIDPDTNVATSSGMCIPVNKLETIGLCLKTLNFGGK